MAPRKPDQDNYMTGQGASQGVTFQREEGALTRAFVLHVDVRSDKVREDSGKLRRSAESRLEEITGLAEAIDLEVAGRCIVPLVRIVPATYLGSGKVEELAAMVRAAEAELVIFDGQLSPGQQRNLERAWKVKVVDRTGLILEIFGRRAQTSEGALQVELAHLEYQKTRLVRSWTHLERQRGGYGFLGGPGETQIEADRRIIRDRILAIKKQLDAVKRTRALHRSARRRVPYPIVALVGYTNAGKSTLFNRLTSASVFAKDLLFATLDPTMRQLSLPHGNKIILSDTVGFISELPTMLIEAFRATLEEVLEADLIVHVRDIHHPETEEQSADVRSVLAELGVDASRRETMIEFWNKTDLLTRDDLCVAEQKSERMQGVVLGSAATGAGLSLLTQLIEERLASLSTICRIELQASQGADLAWLYENGEVLERRTYDTGNMSLTVRFAPEKLGSARSRFAERLEENDERDQPVKRYETAAG
jgi:GTP-binding protein HflX